MKNHYKSITDDLSQSTLVVRDAIGDNSERIAYFLQNLGKRCKPRWVQMQRETSDTVRRNFYEQFKTWLAAIYLANPSGAEYLLSDLEIFMRKVKLAAKGAKQFPTEIKTIQLLAGVKSSLAELETALMFGGMRLL